MKKTILIVACTLVLGIASSCNNNPSVSNNSENSDASNSINNISSISSTSSEVEKFNVSITIIGKGDVKGDSGVFKQGIELTYTATPLENWTFDGYYLNDINVCSDLSYTFTVNENMDIIAKFSEKSTINDEYIYQTFSHKFLQSDFNDTKDGYATQPGSKQINGITWDYDKFTFLGQSSNGIQIGSKKAPQVEPWHIKTNFNEEVTLTSLSISGVNSTGTKFELKGSNNQIISETFTNSDYQVYTFDEIDIPTNSLDFSFSTTAKSFYLDIITFTCKIDKDSTLQFLSDNETATPAVPGENGVPMTKYSPVSKEEYYKDIDFNQIGLDLKSDLNSLISIMDKYSYGDDTNIMLYTDANPENAAYLYGIYDGDDIAAVNSGIWNKEHVWACSQMGLGGNDRPTSSTKNRSSDLHNLRVSCQNSNGLHGNMFFDDENGQNTTFFVNILGTPNASHNYSGDHRGDVARILFYMETRYYTEGLHLDNKLDKNDNMSMGKLETLIRWHQEDPVDDFELQRNNRIYEYQGNRNPFIDYPELVNKIYA